MENALWNGQQLTASEISKNYVLEKKVRKASGYKELCCPDVDCQNPILRYCHGEKKNAYFAHLSNENCDYAIFDRENPQIIKNVGRQIYEQLKSKGFQVYPEVKIIPHHYTHISVETSEGKIIAIEIGTQRVSANMLDGLAAAYLKKDIEVKWIVLDDTSSNVLEDQTYFLKRYCLNESKSRDLIVVTLDGKSVAQYKVDPNIYEYNGCIINSDNYPKTYFERASITELMIDSEELTIEGYNGRYNNWRLKKQSAFEKKVLLLEEKRKKAEILRNEEEKLRKQQLERINEACESSAKSLSIPSKPLEWKPAKGLVLNMTYDQCKEEILSLIDQQDTIVRDSMGKRWIKCKKCGCIGREDKFGSYGGENSINLGICYDCDGVERPK